MSTNRSSLIRRAESAADRLAVTEVAHAASHPQQPLAHFQALRLAHPRRALATWWLLESDGRPACSLVCHPLSLCVDGRVVPAYGVGAVSTRPEQRRRGFARELCEAAIAGAEAAGREVGLLYSAIPPAYYERLQFRALPAWQHEAVEPVALAASGPQSVLIALDPRREAARLAALWTRHHAGQLSVARDADGVLANVALNTQDLFFGVGPYGAGEPPDGYVRTCLEDGVLEVTELIVPPGERASVLRAVAHLAAALGASRLVGWFPPGPDLGPLWRDVGRARTLPMVRGAGSVSASQFWPSDYF